jgi:hypothetical protein
VGHRGDVAHIEQLATVEAKLGTLFMRTGDYAGAESLLHAARESWSDMPAVSIQT